MGATRDAISKLEFLIGLFKALWPLIEVALKSGIKA